MEGMLSKLYLMIGLVTGMINLALLESSNKLVSRKIVAMKVLALMRKSILIIFQNLVLMVGLIVQVTGRPCLVIIRVLVQRYRDQRMELFMLSNNLLIQPFPVIGQRTSTLYLVNI